MSGQIGSCRMKRKEVEQVGTRLLRVVGGCRVEVKQMTVRCVEIITHRLMSLLVNNLELA